MSAGSGTTGKQGGWNAESNDAEAVIRELELWADRIIFRTAVHRAVVKKDDDDSILVYIPATGLDELNPDHWMRAFPAAPQFADAPEAGDDVFVFFESGDLNQAKWTWAEQSFAADPDTGEIKKQ